MPRILLTFTGFHDPYSRGLIGDEEQPGPILSLASARAFDEIVLISTPNTKANREATAAALSAAVVREISLPMQDPASDYDWLGLALESHDRVPFHGILLSQDLVDGCGHNCDAFVEFLGALDSPQWEARRRRTLTIRKCEADYRAALGPILRHAKKLQLVDRT